MKQELAESRDFNASSHKSILVMDRITATAIRPDIFDNRNRDAVGSTTTAVIFFQQPRIF